MYVKYTQCPSLHYPIHYRCRYSRSIFTTASKKERNRSRKASPTASLSHQHVPSLNSIMTDLPILSHQTVPAATSSAGTFSVPPLTTADSSSFSRRRGSHRSLDSTNPDGKRSLRRLAVKPLKIAGNLRRGLSPSPSNNRLSGGMTTPQGSTPTFTPKESNLALTPSSSAGSMSTNDPSSKVMAARGRVKPREGEEVLAMLRLRVVRCEGLVAKDRNGTSDP